jgi:hypothetical protein
LQVRALMDLAVFPVPLPGELAAAIRQVRREVGDLEGGQVTRGMRRAVATELVIAKWAAMFYPPVTRQLPRAGL